MLGTDVTLALNAFSARHPHVTVELVRLSWWTQARDILDGSVDVGLVRPPSTTPGWICCPCTPSTSPRSCRSPILGPATPKCRSQPWPTTPSAWAPGRPS
ncbi:LysR substrate-binding domain-containing protein [Streptomyces caeruleatus]|uniref:LysR substrate-binding domain-containing protein n=1 Tax=Streptomyces caeruleatus TaxID=661399 RepID=A0A101U9B6_9ACTN|nr:LysR substrate-binding domain-containing protein [Streptomyces caeruleatus]KUO06597.1 hypothetical protein AQJ67_01155 [Streptomyces caeruleatus]